MPTAGTSPLIRDVMNGALNGRVNGSGLFSSFDETKLTDAEVAAGIVPVDYGFPPKDLRRYGIVPNSAAARAQNSAYLKALLDPTMTGPVGWFLFTNTTGADTYYFDSVIIQIRDGCRLDLCKTTVDFAGSFNAANDTFGFFTMIRDVEICNGSINVNYNGAAGTNNGFVMRVGGRVGYGFAGVLNFMEEAIPTIGGCHIHDLHITTNNPGPDLAIVAIGGLQNTSFRKLTFDCQNVESYGIYYEFGDWHYEATVANRKSSHAINLVVDQITAVNLKTSGGAGAVVGVVGANPCTISNIYGNGCYSPLEFRCGEALFYNTGPPYGVPTKTRWHTITNIYGVGCTGYCQFVGSESAAGGYLAGSGLTDAQQCDLQGFVVTNLCMDNGAVFNGPFIMNGGILRSQGGSGLLFISQDCLSFEINSTQILDGTSNGIRADAANTIRAVPRNKRGIIRGAKVAGNVGIGISLAFCDDVRVQDCQLGYSTLYDNANEATQTIGVAVTGTGSGVVVDNNYVLTSGGANAYNKTTGPAGCTFISGRGTATLNGEWLYGGPRILSTVTYSASMTPDCTQGNEFIITATNGTAFTINAPLNPLQTLIDITIRNAAGGALGAATFNAVFKLGAAWTQPANAFSRTITFRWNATNWVEVGRTAADVSN